MPTKRKSKLVRNRRMEEIARPKRMLKFRRPAASIRQSATLASGMYWNTLKNYPGLFGDYTYTPEQHNGYPTNEVVMSKANSSHMGAFALAPGYSS